MPRGDQRGERPSPVFPPRSNGKFQDIDERTGLFIPDGRAIREPLSGLLVDRDRPGSYDGDHPGYEGVIEQPEIDLSYSGPQYLPQPDDYNTTDF